MADTLEGSNIVGLTLVIGFAFYSTWLGSLGRGGDMWAVLAVLVLIFWDWK